MSAKLGNKDPAYETKKKKFGLNLSGTYVTTVRAITKETCHREGSGGRGGLCIKKIGHERAPRDRRGQKKNREGKDFEKNHGHNPGEF